MAFKITARTLLELGAELISSDSIAFYELIKNAFDARSPRVEISVVIRIPYTEYEVHHELITAELAKNLSRREASSVLQNCRELILKDLDGTAPLLPDLKAAIGSAGTLSNLLAVLEKANFIQINDTGHGMTLKDLETKYLTIGTRTRYEEKRLPSAKAGDRPILGEKGIGRLSIMRLGWILHLESTTAGDSNWNCLDIDWRMFSHDSDKYLEDIDVNPTIGSRKETAEQHGTRITIYGLSSGWGTEKLTEIASQEFSKLRDPFVSQSAFPIVLRLNEVPVSIPRFEKILFDHAHATLKAQLDINGDDVLLSGAVNYKLRSKQRAFSLDTLTCLSLVRKVTISPEVLKSVGPFSVEVYWYNRQLLQKLEGIGDRKRVLELQHQWGGGLMVYRDGFRVNPYGGPDDDWLDLDKKALASSGYKVNRHQIIGCVKISSKENPALVDQTNREGLRDCVQKQILVAILRHIMEVQFRQFLNDIDKDYKGDVRSGLDDIRTRVNAEEQTLRNSINSIVHKLPDLQRDTKTVTAVNESLSRISKMVEETKKIATSLENAQGDFIHLAGIGLMVEIIAHELSRATAHTLASIAEFRDQNLDPKILSLLQTLESQLRTIQKRLRLLDVASTATRQIKESFDLIDWVREIISSHELQFERHRVKWSLSINPPPTKSKQPQMMVRMVKGMFVQILENLLSNSLYWLDFQRKQDIKFKPAIEIVIDIESKQLRWTDNGPGIPLELRETVFQPFYTTKPPREGKGLGLYIARENAAYHKAALLLSDEQAIRPGRLNTFVLLLEANAS